MRAHTVLSSALAVLMMGCLDDDPVAVGDRGLPLETAEALVPPGVVGGYTGIDLGALDPSHDFVRPNDINASGVVVGLSGTIPGRGFMWMDGTLHDLGALGQSSEAWDINDAGAIAMAGHDGQVQVAYTLDQGVVSRLGTLGGPNALAFAINEAGQVVGSSQALPDPGADLHAFFWDGAMHDLGSPNGQTVARFVNEQGQVAGVTGGGLDSRAFFWDGATMHLFTLAGASVATGLNDHGQVVGYSDFPDGRRHAFLWEDGTILDLGTLGGMQSQALDINNAGQVVGFSHVTSASDATAFLWENGVMTALPGLGGNQSTAVVINEAGVIAGTARIPEGATHGIVWDGGTMYHLEPPEPGQAFPVAINEAGQVVGTFHPSGGDTKAVLWRRLQPVDALDALVADLEALAAAGDLSPGELNSLLAKLHTATALINDGKTKPAGNLLNAFVKEVEAMVASGRLDSAVGSGLIAAAQTVASGL